jgi:pimeloyl-ACP methyl ester carboxylesterase
MRVNIDESKYAEVDPGLKDRFFSFMRTAEFTEMRIGSFDWQYLDTGNRDAAPLIFFTGGIKFPIYSFAVIEAFGRSCRVLAPAQPRCRSLAEFFGGVDAILDGEGIREFSVAGSSWGGQLAQVAAIRYADRMRKVVLASTGISSGGVLSLLLRMHRRSVGKKNPEAVVEGFRARALKMLEDSPAAASFWRAVFDDLYTRYMSYEDYLSLIDTQIDYVERYAPEVLRRRISKPVLVLTSRDETAGTVRMRRGLLRAYPHAQFHEFQAGGHHPALLHLEEYRRVVEAFLSNGGQVG